MQQDSEIYVGLDTSKLKISVALATAGRDGEVRFFGDIDSTPEAVARLVAKLEKRHGRLAFCYRAGLGDLERRRSFGGRAALHLKDGLQVLPSRLYNENNGGDDGPISKRGRSLIRMRWRSSPIEYRQ